MHRNKAVFTQLISVENQLLGEALLNAMKYFSSLAENTSKSLNNLDNTNESTSFSEVSNENDTLSSQSNSDTDENDDDIEELIVIENAYKKDKPVTYSPILEKHLPIQMPQKPNTLDGFNDEKIHLPAEYAPVKSNLSFVDFDEAESTMQRLQVMHTLCQHLLENFKSDQPIIDHDYKALLPFSRAIKSSALGRNLPIDLIHDLKTKLLALSRELYHTAMQNNAFIIENLSAVSDVINQLLKSYPQHNNEESKEESQNKKKRKNITANTSQEPDSASSSTTKNLGLFAKSNKKNRLEATNNEICAAIRDGNVELLMQAVGADASYASRFIPGDSGDTYLMYVMRSNKNVASMVAALLTGDNLYTVPFDQMFHPKNWNEDRKGIIALAIEYNNLDALKEGVALAALQHRKVSEKYIRIIDNNTTKLSSLNTKIQPL